MIGIVIAMRFMSKKPVPAFVSLVWGPTATYQSSCHGLSTSMSAWAKSRTLRVTSLQSHARAVAAMIESKAAMDLPCASACTVICAQACDLGRVGLGAYAMAEFKRVLTLATQSTRIRVSIVYSFGDDHA